MAGASPDIMASTVAEPLERRLGTIADVAELTSISYVGSSMIVVEFGLNRDINGAARDVEAAIQAARADLPTTLRSNPTYRQYNPADAPIMVLALTSNTLTKAQLYDSADSVIQQQLSQVERRGTDHAGRRRVAVGAGRVAAGQAEQLRHRPRRRARGDQRGQRRQREGPPRPGRASATWCCPTTRSPRQRPTATLWSPIVTARQCCCATSPRSGTRTKISATPGSITASRRCW